MHKATAARPLRGIGPKPAWGPGIVRSSPGKRCARDESVHVDGRGVGSGKRPRFGPGSARHGPCWNPGQTSPSTTQAVNAMTNERDPNDPDLDPTEQEPRDPDEDA